jgi:2-polyprenyl-6-methoxyphenol hydroxylase-like FAD-dependent oxidoreductase
MPSSETDVLIVGAGPTGLALAIWLNRLGIRVRIVDKTAEAGTTSRAFAVHARTLDFYRQLGFADSIVDAGMRALDWQVHVYGAAAQSLQTACADAGTIIRHRD